MTPTPAWSSCLVEIYEGPGWMDDGFRTGWTLVAGTSSQSFENTGTIAGDYAEMEVTEGGTPAGCSYEKDISGLSRDTDDFPLVRTRLRGGGTSPQYRIRAEYADATSTITDWASADTTFFTRTFELTPGKTISKIRLYAKSNEGSQTAHIDWDYVAILRNPPLVPDELEGVEVDLETTTAVEGFKLRLLGDPLAGMALRQYRFEEESDYRSKAYDLSKEKGHGDVIGGTYVTGKHGTALSFDGVDDRLETGLLTQIKGDGPGFAIALWMKADPGATGVIAGFGKAPGGTWNRVQLNFSSNKVRLYARDDSENVLQHTSTATLADGTWHHLVAVVNPSGDEIQVYVDGDLDGGASGTLGTITLDVYDLTFGCLHSQGGYTSHSAVTVDEAQVHSRALGAKDAYNLYAEEPRSGAVRAGVGDIVSVYVANVAVGEALEEKLIKGRIVDRLSSGEPDNPIVALIGEGMGELMMERTYTDEFATPTQISAIVEDVVDDELPEFTRESVDTTNRTLENVFRDQPVFSLLQSLSKAASFSTGEKCAPFWVDPGGDLHFQKPGAYAGPDLSDGSDGNDVNIQGITVRETMKGSPPLANDVKVIIYEAEHMPRDEDSWTENADDWSSPDPQDEGSPTEDTGDAKSGEACIRFNTTNPGSQFRMRVEIPPTDVTAMTKIRFWFKYGSGLQPENLAVYLFCKSSWLWENYWEKEGITPPSADTWAEVELDLGDFSVGEGYPTKDIRRIIIKAYRSSGDLGTGGFKIDKLRFERPEVAVTAGDTDSQARYGRRRLVEVDKTITNKAYAQYVADGLLEHHRNPTVHVRVATRGLAQPGYRPPQHVQLTSLKDGIYEETFQIQRARHRLQPGDYTCELELLAARKPDGSYEPKVAPQQPAEELGGLLARVSRRQVRGELGLTRGEWTED